MPAITQTPAGQLAITWPLLPADFILPDDPVENTDQPLLAAALRQIVAALPERMQDALIMSNFALCAGIRGRMICKAPDWMYVQPVQPWTHSSIRRSYTPHTEGPIPFVVMEFLSETYGEEYSVEFTNRIGKWFFYEQVIKVPTYVIFQPETASLEVYVLESERYQLQSADENGLYWIAGIELFLGVWQGSHEGRIGYWLRWWNAAGELLLWPEERVEQERQEKESAQHRAAVLEARLREMGVDPEQL